MASADTPDLAAALGRVPTGLYVVTTRASGRPLGFVASFLMQVGFAPPTLCVAIAKGRAHLQAIREAGTFGVSILDGPSEGLMGRFFRKHAPGESPFDGLDVSDASHGSPILEGALAWLECRHCGEHETPDHVVVFGEVIEGATRRGGDPSIHLRRTGMVY